MVSGSCNVAGKASDGAEGSFVWLRRELVASWTEICTVLILSLGYYIFASTGTALVRLKTYIAHGGRLFPFQPTNYGELRLIAELSAILALLLLFLHSRGWNLKDFRLKMSWGASLQAIPLFAVAVMAPLIVDLIIAWHHAHPRRVASALSVPFPATHLTWMVAFPHQVLNAVCEEVICISYAFNQVAAKRGPLVAFGFTLFLRLSYHTWKAPVSFGMAAIMFSIYGLWYWRFRNVWPLILAHASYDLLIVATQIR